MLTLALSILKMIFSLLFADAKRARRLLVHPGQGVNEPGGILDRAGAAAAVHISSFSIQAFLFVGQQIDRDVLVLRQIGKRDANTSIWGFRSHLSRAPSRQDRSYNVD